MKDALGHYLEQWRIREALPHIRGRLLDLGCGLNHLVRRYGDGLGADVYQWGDVDVVLSNAGSLPFEAEAFDTVTILAALNHIPNRAAALREACRVLRPGGRLVMTMIPPTLSRIWHRLRRPWDPDQTERGMKEGEVWGLTRRQVHKLLNDAGFRIILQRSFMLGVNLLTVGQK